MDKFLEKLRALLTSTNADATKAKAEKTLYDLVYGSVEEAVKKNPSASAQDVVNAMQSVIDAQIAEMTEAVKKNEKAWTEKKNELDTPKGKVAKSENVKIAGAAGLVEKADALETLNSDKLQAIIQAANDEGLYANGAYALNTDFKATLVTSIDHVSEIDKVKGTGTLPPTERSAIQGKIRKGGTLESRGVDRKSVAATFVVRPDLFTSKGPLPDNGRIDFDTLNGIAEAWLAANGGGKGITLPATTYNGTNYGAVDLDHPVDSQGKPTSKLQAVTHWLVRKNNMKRKDDSYCNGKTFEGYVMHVGDELAVPETKKPLAPKQYSVECTTCRVNNTPKSETLEIGKAHALIVGVEPGIVVAPPPPDKPKEQPKDDKVHFSTRLPTAPEEKGVLNKYTLSWYAELYAMSSMEVAKKHYLLPSVTPNKETNRENQTSETVGFQKQGDYSGKDANSRKDDDFAKKRVLNGKNSLSDPAGNPHDNGHIVDVNDQDGLVRSGKVVTRFIGPGNYATADFGITTHLGRARLATPLPAVYIPSDQLALFSKTERYGLTQGRYIMAEVQLGGYDNRWADQRSWSSNPMESPDTVGCMMFIDYNQKYFAKKMAEVESKTGQERTDAAREAYKAFRDIQENPMVRMADARAASTMKSNMEALDRFMSEDMKVDVAAIKAEIKDLSAHPRILPEVLGEKEQEELKKVPGISGGAISGMKLEKVKALYKVAADHIYGVQNKIEHEIAQGKANEMDDAQSTTKGRETMAMILRKDDGTVNEPAVQAVADYIARFGQGGGEAIGHLLHDVLKNPKSYMKDGKALDKKTAEAMVKAVLGEDKEGKEALTDLQHQGRSRGTPFVPLSALLQRDEAYPATNTKEIGDAVSKTAKANSQALVAILELASGDEPGKRTDSRPHMKEMLHNMGSERNYNVPENEESKTIAAIKATLSEEKGKIFHDNIRDMVAYTESGASGFSVTAREQSDNIMRAGILNENADRKTVLKELTATDSRKKFLAESLKARPHMAADVVLATIMRDPAALKDLDKGLKDYAKSISNGLEEYHVLRSVINRTMDEAKKYHTGGGNVDDLVDATEKFAVYFHKLEAKAAAKERSGKAIKASQRANAWDGLMTLIGDSQPMSDALVKTIESSATLSDAFLMGVPDATAIINMQHGKVPTKAKQKAFVEDQYYSGSLFTLPTNKDGEVTRGGLFNRKHAKANRDGIEKLLIELGTVNGPTELAQQQDANGNPIAIKLDDQSQATIAQMQTQEWIKNKFVLHQTGSVYIGSQSEMSKLQGADFNKAAAEQLYPEMRKTLDSWGLQNKQANGSFIPYTKEQVVQATISMIENGYVKFIKQAEDLVMQPTQKAKDRLIEDFNNLNSQPGLDRKLALGLIRFPTKILQLPPGWGQCLDCIPGGRGG